MPGRSEATLSAASDSMVAVTDDHTTPALWQWCLHDTTPSVTPQCLCMAQIMSHQSPLVGVTLLMCIILKLWSTSDIPSHQASTLPVETDWLVTQRSNFPVIVYHIWNNFPSHVYTCVELQIQSRIGDRSFSVAGPQLLNNLSTEIRRRGTTFEHYRRILKAFLFV